jgi:hypothetical protein
VKIRKVISGGQTGADQAGLRAARSLGLATGGTAPSNYYTSNGPMPSLILYGLTAKGSYNERTRQNIIDSDATLIIAEKINSPGTNLTISILKELNKPYFVADVSELMSRRHEATPEHLIIRLCEDICEWLSGCTGDTLNVAGNREHYIGDAFGELAQVICATVFMVAGENNQEAIWQAERR